jgi:hypothetical protein
MNLATKASCSCVTVGEMTLVSNKRRRNEVLPAQKGCKQRVLGCECQVKERLSPPLQPATSNVNTVRGLSVERAAQLETGKCCRCIAKEVVTRGIMGLGTAVVVKLRVLAVESDFFVVVLASQRVFGGVHDESSSRTEKAGLPAHAGQTGGGDFENSDG